MEMLAQFFLPSFNLASQILTRANSDTMYLLAVLVLPSQSLAIIHYLTHLPQQALLQNRSHSTTPSRQPQPDQHHSKAAPSSEKGKSSQAISMPTAVAGGPLSQPSQGPAVPIVVRASHCRHLGWEPALTTREPTAITAQSQHKGTWSRHRGCP